jgi:signal transduction histidine kinase
VTARALHPLLAAAAALGLLAGSRTLRAEERQAAPQKSVLVLSGGRPDLPVNAVVNRIIRSRLEREFGADVDLRFEYVEPEPEPGTSGDALRDFLGRKYAEHRFDLLIAIVEPAAAFLRAHGERLFRGVPVVGWGTPSIVEGRGPGFPIAGVVNRSDPAATAEFILRLQPDTRRIVVLGGSSPSDEELIQEARGGLVRLEGRVDMTYLGGLTLEQVRGEVARLSDRTAILFLTMGADAAGRRLVNVEALAAILEAARVPTYSIAESYLGTGIVGGVLISQQRGAEGVAELAVRVLRGERVEHIPTVELGLQPTVDWRQLRRWGIREDRLPLGTVVLHREPPVWEAYRWHIVGVVSLCVVQGVLIAGLLVQRSQRRRAVDELLRSESVAREQRQELAHLSRVAVLGELTGTMAHELNQPLAAILANAQAAQTFLARGPEYVPMAQEALEGVVEADVRAGDIIKRLRGMLKRGEFQGQRLDLGEIAREALALADGDVRRRDVRVATDLARGLPAVVGDRVQLQQVLLNLILNACDAMAGTARPERLLTVAASPGANGTVVLSVEDRGTGIPESDLERVFEPFQSTKAQGLGLGLSICRTIVSEHGGRLWAANNAERGATFHLELPRAGEGPS